MRIEKLVDARNLLAILFSIGIVQIAGYYVAGMLASPDGGMAVPQPDTLLYCQAARRIAEGCPFSFSEGTAVSTGTTSVLYPFVLAIPYVLGARGDLLLTAGFALNALFYLVFLWGWWIAFERWLDRPLARITATILLALSCQPVYCALSQSDIGCWLALSGLLAAGLATGNRWLYGLMLLIGPWFRPEGMVCVIAFVAVLILRRFLSRYGLIASIGKDGRFRADFLIGLLGVISALGVFALNYALSGHAQFSSVANKGYFVQKPFSLAFFSTMGDFVSILKGLLLGASTSLPRDLFQMPVLSGLALLVAIFTYPWKDSGKSNILVFVLASFGGILTVANSGWQGTNFDRYLVWMSPLVTLFVAEGVCVVAERLPVGINRLLPSAVLIAFALACAVTSIFAFNRASFCSDLALQFALECEAVLPRKASIGAMGNCGLCYCLSPRRFSHVSGIYSPEFSTRLGYPGYLSILKNEPSTRFSYWLEDVESLNSLFGGEFRSQVEKGLQKTGPDGLQLVEANWTPFERARQPLSSVLPRGKRLVDRVDVAYEKDEKRTDYEIIDRYGRPGFLPFNAFDDLGDTKIAESGRVLVGGDSMTVNLCTNTAVTVILRTLPRQKITSYSFGRRMDEYAFTNPLSMRIAVNGEDAGLVTCSYATNGFSDVSFEIPAAAITRSPARIAFLGDHIACGYWFYQ